MREERNIAEYMTDPGLCTVRPELQTEVAELVSVDLEAKIVLRQLYALYFAKKAEKDITLEEKVFLFSRGPKFSLRKGIAFDEDTVIFAEEAEIYRQSQPSSKPKGK